MLAQDVGGVFITINMIEPDDGTHNGFVHTMEGKGIVVLMELGVGDRGAVYDRLVVSKHICLLADRDTQITQGVPEINGLIYTIRVAINLDP